MATERSEETHYLTFLWRVENLGLWETDCGWSGLVSSWLRSCSVGEMLFGLTLYPKGVTCKDEHLILKLKSYESLNFPIDCEWSFIGSNGSPLVSGTMRKQVMVGIEPFLMFDCPTYEEVFVTRKSAFLPHDTLTVRFRIWSSDGDLSNSEFVSCRSRFETIDYSFLWPVKKFSALQCNQEVTFPIVLDDERGRSGFLLKFSLKGVSLEDACANFELTPVLISTSLSMTVKVSVLDNEQKVMKSMEMISKKCFSKSDKETRMLPKFISRKELLKKKNECLKNDVLTLRCEIPTLQYFFFNDQYYYGFSNLDVESKKYTSMFLDASCQTSEHVSNIQSVPDLDVHTINRMLTFLYGGTIEPDLHLEGASKLYYAADKYQIQSLKQQCSLLMQSNIQVSNVSDILTVADRHEDVELTSFVHDFFLNNFDEIMQNEEWIYFQQRDSALAMKTVHQIYMKKLHAKLA